MIRRTSDEALIALDIIRKSHDTTEMTGAEFAELSRAVVFYLKGGHLAEQAAKLAAEEIFPLTQN